MENLKICVENKEDENKMIKALGSEHHKFKLYQINEGILEFRGGTINRYVVIIHVLIGNDSFHKLTCFSDVSSGFLMSFIKFPLVIKCLGLDTVHDMCIYYDHEK